MLLWCEYEDEQYIVAGTDGVDDQNEWKVASLGVLLDPWHSIPRAFHGLSIVRAYLFTHFSPGEQFAYVLGGNLAIPQFAWLTSDTIPCLLTLIRSE